MAGRFALRNTWARRKTNSQGVPELRSYVPDSEWVVRRLRSEGVHHLALSSAPASSLGVSPRQM